MQNRTLSYHRYRRGVITVLTVGAYASISLAEADNDSAREPVVAVLPLGTADPLMQIYSAPVAEAMANTLSVESKMRIEALSMSWSMPARIDLVVDGSIVSGEADTIVLEARVRDPERGRTIYATTTLPGPLREIDELARSLALKLAPALRSAAAAQRRQRARESAALRPAPPPIQSSSDSIDDSATVNAVDATALPSRPYMVIFTASGQVADGLVPVTAIATRAGQDLARILGYSPVVSPRSGIIAASDAEAVLDRTRASYGLMIDVVDIEFRWQEVLLARGRVRVAVVNRRGERIFDRISITDSLIGSRGDRHAALVRFVMEQTVDILTPILRRVLDVPPPAAPARMRP